MDAILTDLIQALKSTSSKLDTNDLDAKLHDTETLPEKKLVGLASEALDLLDSLRQRLEPRHLVLADHYYGFLKTKALCTAVELDIPDILAHGPKTLPELAKASTAREDRLQQVMCTLRNDGIFSYSAETGMYENNSTSTLLLSNHWTQWRNWIDFKGNLVYDMARGIPAACKSDAIRSPAQINYDTDDSMIKYFTDQGWIPRIHNTLSGGAIAQAPGIVHDYPWDEVASSTILDVGGGGGGLIASLLRAYPNMTGGILEIPRVIEQAKINFHSADGMYADVGDRVHADRLIAGDFMVEVPSFEVYTMKWCLHNWDDDQASVVLKCIRRAIKEGQNSRLVILEFLLADGHMGRMSRYGDMDMMVVINGKERSEKEWENLAGKSGWKLRKVVPLRNTWPCAIEFVPAELPHGDS